VGAPGRSTKTVRSERSSMVLFGSKTEVVRMIATGLAWSLALFFVVGGA
jgi:hypothetical protein